MHAMHARWIRLLLFFLFGLHSARIPSSDTVKRAIGLGNLSLLATIHITIWTTCWFTRAACNLYIGLSDITVVQHVGDYEFRRNYLTRMQNITKET